MCRDLAVCLDEGGPTNFSGGVHGGELLSPGFVTTQGFEEGTFPFVLAACCFQGAGKTRTSESMQNSITDKTLKRFGELTDLPTTLETRTRRADIAATAVPPRPSNELRSAKTAVAKPSGQQVCATGSDLIEATTWVRQNRF
jgi:hypothetical protein